MKIYKGNIVYSESIKELKEIYIIVNNGVIHPESPNPAPGSN